MRSGIAIDDWKQPIFEQILSDQGWTFKVGPGVTDDTRIIHVVHDPSQLFALSLAVRYCQAKASELKN